MGSEKEATITAQEERMESSATGDAPQDSGTCEEQGESMAAEPVGSGSDTTAAMETTTKGPATVSSAEASSPAAEASVATKVVSPSAAEKVSATPKASPAAATPTVTAPSPAAAKAPAKTPAKTPAKSPAASPNIAAPAPKTPQPAASAMDTATSTEAKNSAADEPVDVVSSPQAQEMDFAAEDAFAQNDITLFDSAEESFDVRVDDCLVNELDADLLGSEEKKPAVVVKEEEGEKNVDASVTGDNEKTSEGGEEEAAKQDTAELKQEKVEDKKAEDGKKDDKDSKSPKRLVSLVCSRH